jgi:cell division septation protein DedD
MNKKKSPDRSKPGAEQRTRKELLVKGFLCSLVCLWMFVIGLLVGRGTAPIRFDIERLQDELADLKAATIEETVQRYQVAFQELDREKDLGFHEALKDEETRLPSAAFPSADSTSGSATGQMPAETGLSVPKKTKDSEFVKPAAVENGASEPPKQQAAATGGAWAIQVAATQDKAQGDQLVDRLERLGYQAKLVRATIAGKGTWYRVRVVGYTSRQAAEVDLAKLEKERYSPMIISP